MSDAEMVAIVMEVIRANPNEWPISTRRIKELSNGRLRGHEHEITPLMKVEADEGRVERLDYETQYEGFRYRLSNTAGR